MGSCAPNKALSDFLRPAAPSLLLCNGDKAIARHTTEALRFLVHWSAEVFEDCAELKRSMDGTDNLSFDQVFETFIRGLRARKVSFEMPSDPLRDPAFIRTLSETYDFGCPVEYPEGVYPDNPFAMAA